MKHKLFISCEEAAHRIDKAQYGEANLYEKLTYKIHIVYCTLCRNYASKSRELTQVLKSQSIKLLSPTQKQRMKETMAKENINF